MKAKDYAALYAAGTKLHETGNMFLIEPRAIAASRHATSDAALLAIFDEQNRKWRAFCRLTGDAELRPDGFELLMDRAMPVIGAVWRAWRENRSTR